ncbi:CBS domain-containing protein [Sediminicoccus sp. BL-A-41-H5]|uniref:CBS domain-containing protein n=1 Tax=Sediminicoccus sp. BL-A-41-H5 TaxID=3421106 RepID=UPI003D678152
MKSKDLMTTNPVVVSPDTPVAAVAELLAARGISAVPVVDAEGVPQGIVTEGDLIRRLAERPPGPLSWSCSSLKAPSRWWSASPRRMARPPRM